MRSVIVALLLAAAAAFETETSKPGAFNKEELEAILKKDHSDRVSNIFDSDNNIQCVSRAHTLPLPLHAACEMRFVRPRAGTPGMLRCRSFALAWTEGARRKSSDRAVRQPFSVGDYDPQCTVLASLACIASGSKRRSNQSARNTMVPGVTHLTLTPC